MNIKPLGNKLHVEKLPVRTQTPSGILLPAIREAEQGDFRVISAGPGRKLKNGSVVPPEPQPGDRVALRAYADGVPLPDGTRIIDADDVLMILP